MRNWYLIQTNPRQEYIAEENISNQGFEVYLPKFTVKSQSKALFPGYVFANLASDTNWVPLFSTKGVKRFVKFGNQFAIVPDVVINSIKTNEGSMQDKIGNLSKHKKGDKLEVISGPLKGFNVSFDRYTDNERIIILFQMLHQTQKATLKEEQVRTL